jgi:hypothetical protein
MICRAIGSPCLTETLVLGPDAASMQEPAQRSPLFSELPQQLFSGAAIFAVERGVTEYR